jgi:hypothetical protein
MVDGSRGRRAARGWRLSSVVASGVMLAAVLVLPQRASAQQLAAAGQQPPALADAPQAPAPAQGPLVVQPVRSGPVVAFDVKVTEFDHDTAWLLGGYGGWITDERFLIGGAGYWMVDGPNDTELFYGGLLVGWQVPAGKVVRFGVRGLVGGGQATLWDQFYVESPEHPNRPRPMPVHGGGYFDGYPDCPGCDGGWGRYAFYQGFFVFEPQADATIAVTDRLGLHLGVGYRVIAGAGDFNDRLQGLTGSVALQVGVF